MTPAALGSFQRGPCHLAALAADLPKQSFALSVTGFVLTAHARSSECFPPNDLVFPGSRLTVTLCISLVQPIESAGRWRYGAGPRAVAQLGYGQIGSRV
jgi:hypothetical protein